MIKFRELSDEHPDFVFSPLLRAARLTLSYMVENGPIGITKTKSCKRYFVQWAVQHFEWPDMGYADLMRYHKNSLNMISNLLTCSTSYLSNYRLRDISRMSRD